MKGIEATYSQGKGLTLELGPDETRRLLILLRQANNVCVTTHEGIQSAIADALLYGSTLAAEEALEE